MTAERAKAQLAADVSRFFGPFRRNEEAKYNLGLGEIECRNALMEEAMGQKEKIAGKLLSSLSKYPGCQGYMPLNEKIAELIKAETGMDFNPGQIVLTAGAADAISHAVFVYSHAGEKVMFPVPSFPYWCSVARNESLIEPIMCMPQDFSDKLSGRIEARAKNVSMLILNVPHNPYGCSIERGEAEKINETASRHKIKVVIDDVYRAFTKKEWIGNSFDMENSVIVDSLSKRFGVPGLRLGFAALPKMEVKHFRAAVANQYVGVSMPSAIIADALLEAYLSNKKLNTIPKEIEKRQEILDSYLKKLEPYGIFSQKPEGGMFRAVFCRDANLLAAELAGKNVIVKGGRSNFPFSYAGMPEFIRISVGGEERIREAAEIIAETVKEIEMPLEGEKIAVIR